MIDLSRIQELEDFIFDQESEEALKQIEKCDTCNWGEPENGDCMIKDFCIKYTPIDKEVGANEQNENLIKDLFSTIKFLDSSLQRTMKLNEELAKLIPKRKKEKS